MESDKDSNIESIDQEEREEAEQEVDQELQSEGAESDDLSEVDALKKELDEYKNKFLYSVAELDNTRKRHLKERSELLKYAGENLARDLLEILDDLERVLKPAEEENASEEQNQDTDAPEQESAENDESPSSDLSDGDAQVLREGVELITSRMRALFERFGIKGEPCLGEKFDPNKHEALTMIAVPQTAPGTIVKELKKPYYFKDKLLRPGQVIVAGE